MRLTPRRGLVALSAALILVVVGVAIALGPPGPRVVLSICGLLAVVSGIQAGMVEPRDLATALLLAAVPVVALLAEGSPTVLVLPLGIALFMAAEMNSLAWQCGSALRLEVPARHRLRDALLLTTLGVLGAGATFGLASLELPGGTYAVALSALGLAGLVAGMLGGRRSQGSDGDGRIPPAPE